MNVMLFDTRVGNLHSLAKALETGGARVRIEPDPARLLDGDALVLPGVGAFGAAAERLAPAAAELRAALRGGFPALGICLGMQLLTEASDEGAGAGLGVVAGRVRRLRASRVPHMGWNAVEPVDPVAAASTGAEGRPARSTSDPDAGSSRSADSAPIFAGPDAISAGPDPIFAGTTPLVAYYANSFVVEPADPANVIAWTEYEGERFPAAVRAANAWGVQFHPEKSGEPGLRLIRNFLEAARRAGVEAGR